MHDSSEHPEDLPGRSRRPRSDHATLLSLVVATVALGWTIYAYYFPPAAPVAVPPSVSTSSEASAPSPAASSSPTSLSRETDGRGSGALGWADDVWTRMSDRYEHDRNNRSAWSLLLVWCFMSCLMLWLIADGLRVLAMPVAQLAYIYYYSPSLSGWAIAASIIGGLLQRLKGQGSSYLGGSGSRVMPVLAKKPARRSVCC